MDIGLEEAVMQLKVMFPLLDEEIILSALLQNSNSLDNTIDALLSLQGGFDVDAFPQNNNNAGEISIFSNMENANNSNKNVPNKQVPRKEEAKKENINNNNSRSMSMGNISSKKKENDDKLQIDDSNKPLEVPKSKKTFGQKVSGFFGNIFKKKEKKELGDYKFVNPHDD